MFLFQASYLVGVSDPNSQAGHQGLVDPIQFAKANQAIQMACQNLVDPDSSPSQVNHNYTWEEHMETLPNSQLSTVNESWRGRDDLSAVLKANTFYFILLCMRYLMVLYLLTFI